MTVIYVDFGLIKEKIEIGLPRPRDMEIKGSEEFVRIKMKIWHLIFKKRMCYFALIVLLMRWVIFILII